MWFTVKYLSEEDEVVVTIWGEDERPFRMGGRARAVNDMVAFARCVLGPAGTTAPRCGACHAPVEVPDLDGHVEEAA